MCNLKAVDPKKVLIKTCIYILGDLISTCNSNTSVSLWQKETWLFMSLENITLAPKSYDKASEEASNLVSSHLIMFWSCFPKSTLTCPSH